MSTETKSETYACDVCGKEFDNVRSKAAHMGHGHNKPWQNEKKLREEYVENGRDSYDLADEWGCDSKTVRNWLHKFEIDVRKTGDWQREECATLRNREDGYVAWYDHTGKSRGKSIAVHRLLAVSEYGVDSVKGKHVHHKNGVKWDNRPQNIELKDPSEHAKEHYNRGDLELELGGINEAVEELQNEL